jgi:hypothetical protein
MNDPNVEWMLSTCEKILKDNFWEGGSYRAAAGLTLLLINLSDLLQRVSMVAVRVSFSDETAPCKDVTELILKMRNAACHVNSQGELDYRTTIRLGIMGPLTKQEFAGGGSMENPHDDDIAFYIGKHRAYLRRHLIRAFNQVIDVLLAASWEPSIRYLKV